MSSTVLKIVQIPEFIGSLRTEQHVFSPSHFRDLFIPPYPSYLNKPRLKTALYFMIRDETSKTWQTDHSETNFSNLILHEQLPGLHSPVVSRLTKSTKMTQR